MDDRASCEKAIRNGGIVAMISAAIMAAFAIAGFFTNSTNASLNYLLDPWYLVDVAPVLVLGVFVFRKSRVAATLLVVYYVVSKMFMWAELGKAPGLYMTVIVLYFYANAMRGTFKWHAQYRPAASRRPVSAERTMNTSPAVTEPLRALPQRFCVHCGTRALPDAKFCISCGSSVGGTASPSGEVAG